jgi:hypothetical protein
MGLVLRFLFHCLAIWIGTKAAKVEADFGKVAITTLVGYAAMWLASKLLFPFHWVPLLNLFVGTAAMILGTAAAAVLVMGCQWRQALTIAAVAGVVAFLAGLLISSFSF